MYSTAGFINVSFLTVTKESIVQGISLCQENLAPELENEESVTNNLLRLTCFYDSHTLRFMKMLGLAKQVTRKASGIYTQMGEGVVALLVVIFILAIFGGLLSL